VFPNPRTAEYSSSVPDIAKYLLLLMKDSGYGNAWERRAASAWSIYSTIARLPGNLWRLFPERLVSSKSNERNSRLSQSTHY